jgi:hypothetical protein
MSQPDLVGGIAWNQQVAASLMLEWIESLEATNPIAVTLLNEYFRGSGPRVLDVIKKGLGLTEFKLPGHTPDVAISTYLRTVAGDLAGQRLGQVVPGQIWFDPPTPAPGVQFNVCWDEQNVGYQPTGRYTTMIQIGYQEPLLVYCESLEPGASAQRYRLAQGMPAGSYSVSISTPWLGSEDSKLASPAGRTMWKRGDLAIGQDAEALLQSQQDESAVNDALGWAQGYMSSFAFDDNPDLHPLSYALQSIAQVAQRMNGEYDIVGTATAMLSIDPATISNETFAQARAKAKDAVVVLTSAMARLTADNASPVDHEMTDQGALAILAVATTVQQAEPAESPAGEYEYAEEIADEQGEGSELDSEDASGETTEEVLAEAEGQGSEY